MDRQTSSVDYVPPVFAIDPGITTGWCFVDRTRVEHGIVTADEDLTAFLRTRVKMYRPSIIVIERLPNTLPVALRRIVSLVDQALPDRSYSLHPERIHYTRLLVSPGEWKPVTGKLPLPFSPSTQHEKDSFRMAMYVIRRQGFI